MIFKIDFSYYYYFSFRPRAERYLQIQRRLETAIECQRERERESEIMEGENAGSALPPMHPAIAPLSFLLGRWKGQGEGGFPTINSFAYGEELLFSHSGKVSSLSLGSIDL